MKIDRAFLDYYQSLQAGFECSLHELALQLHPDAVHELRVAIKKMRVLVEIAKSKVKPKHLVAWEHMLSEIFKKAGQ